MDANRDLLRIATILLTGFLIPVLLAHLLHEQLALYLTGRQFVYLSAAGFCLVIWPLYAVLDLDRVNFALGAVVFPWVATFALLLFLVAWAERFEGIGWMVGGIEDLFAYGGAIMLAGIAAFVFQDAMEYARSERPWIPRPNRIAVGAVVLLTIGLLAAGGVATITASSAAIADVDAELTDELGMGTIGLVSTVEGDPAELRIYVATPDGTTSVERITPADLATGTTTIEFVEWQVNVPLDAGTYEVTLSAISGFTVDQATFTVGAEATPALDQLDVASPNEELDIDPPHDAVERSTGDTDEVRIGTVLANEGEVPGRFTTRLMTSEGEFITLQDITVPGDGYGVSMQSLSADEVESIRAEGDGTCTVEILQDGEVIDTQEVTLPGEVTVEFP